MKLRDGGVTFAKVDFDLILVVISNCRQSMVCHVILCTSPMLAIKGAPGRDLECEQHLTPTVQHIGSFV